MLAPVAACDAGEEKEERHCAWSKVKQPLRATSGNPTQPPAEIARDQLDAIRRANHHAKRDRTTRPRAAPAHTLSGASNERQAYLARFTRKRPVSSLLVVVLMKSSTKQVVL